MIKVANNISNLLTKQALSSKDLLDMDSFSGLLADYYPIAGVNPAAESRAGRATAMADAIDKNPGFFVKKPITSTLLTSVPLSIAGAFAGNALSRGEDHLTNMLYTLGGTAAGGVLGSLLSSAIRRSGMKDVAKAFDAEKSRKAQDFELGSTFLPYGGMHDLGRAEAIQALRGKIKPSEVGNYGAYPYAAVGGDLAGSLLGVPIPLGMLGTRAAAREEARALLDKGKKNKN
jgi:hypothetical protein